MVFWAERFKHDDEEDMWEELRQILLNPPSVNENELQRQQEMAKINAALDRMFAEKEKTQAQKEPYLTYAELLDKPLKTQGQMSCMADPLEGKVSKTSPRNPYKEIVSKENWSEKLKKQKLAEIAKIQETAMLKEKEINREHLIEQAMNFGGAAFELGSAFVPGYGGTKLAETLAKKITPKVGRKIAQEITTSILKGASSGTVEGFGRGLLEDKNPIKTVAQDTLVGSALGAGIGTIGGNIQKLIKGHGLKNIENLKLLRKKETEFYKDYIQGTKSKHPMIGNIDFTQSGLETVSKQPNAGKNFGSLKRDLNKAEYIAFEKPHHEKHGAKDNITGFHKLNNGYNEFLIAETPNGAKYYMSKQTGNVENRPSRVEPTFPNNSITSAQNNFNPNQQQIPKKLNLYDEWLEELRQIRKRHGW